MPAICCAMRTTLAAVTNSLSYHIEHTTLRPLAMVACESTTPAWARTDQIARHDFRQEAM